MRRSARGKAGRAGGGPNARRGRARARGGHAGTRALRAGRIGLLAALLLSTLLGPSGGAAETPPKTAPTRDPAIRDPATRGGTLKAWLLERGNQPGAAAWALEYTATPEVQRLEPVTRAAECGWAARIGLAAEPSGSERKQLQAILSRVEGCPLDSMAIKRSAQGLTRIGVVVPLTGRYERYGKTLVNGLRLAIEQHNREWAPTLSLILHDSEGDPLVGARKSRWLLKDHGVSLLVGEIFSANTAPLAAATQVIGAVLISPSATNERLAILGDGVFQFHIGPAATASALARQLAADAPHASAALLVAQTPEDSLQAAALERACRSAGVRVAGVERVPDGAVDVMKPLAALRGQRPTALVLIAPPRLVGIVGAQLMGAWPKARVYGFESLDPEGLNVEAREAFEGATYFMNDYVLLGAPRDSFQTRYERAYHEPPTRMSTRGYLTGLAIGRAMAVGSITASNLKSNLRSQVYETDEGRALRALQPVVPAAPERFVIRSGKGVSPAEPGDDP